MADAKSLSIPGLRRVEKPAGLLVILIAASIFAAIITQQEITPDLTTIYDDLSYLGENLSRFILNSFIWLFNSILIILLGPAILISFLPYGRSSAYLTAFIVSSTGILYLLYAHNSFQLIYLIREYLKSPDIETNMLTSLAFSLLISRISFKLIAYTLTGISAIILGQLIARSGYLPRFIGWMAMLGGLVYSVYGWINLESIIFTVGRMFFFLSFIIFGSFLLLRGTRDKTGRVKNR